MWTSPDSELWEWTFASVTLSVVLCMRILAAVSEKQSLPPLGSGICSEYWAFWKLRGIFRLGIFFFLWMRKSGRWLFRLDYYYFFAAFYQYGREKNSGKASFSKDNGGKAILQTLSSSCRTQISKDTVPLAVSISHCSPVTVSNHGRVGKEVWARTSHFTVQSNDICAGSALTAADKSVSRHPEERLEHVALASWSHFLKSWHQSSSRRWFAPVFWKASQTIINETKKRKSIMWLCIAECLWILIQPCIWWNNLLGPRKVTFGILSLLQGFLRNPVHTQTGDTKKQSLIVCPRFDGQLPPLHFQVWCGCVSSIIEVAIL